MYRRKINKSSKGKGQVTYVSRIIRIIPDFSTEMGKECLENDRKWEDAISGTGQ